MAVWVHVPISGNYMYGNEIREEILRTWLLLEMAGRKFVHVGRESAGNPSCAELEYFISSNQNSKSHYGAPSPCLYSVAADAPFIFR